MAQRKRIENPVVIDESIDGGGLESIFQETAAELARLHSLSHNKKIAFDAGLKNAYERAYEWIQLQLQDGKSVIAADMSAYLQITLMELAISRKWETLVYQVNFHVGYGGLEDGGGATASVFEAQAQRSKNDAVHLEVQMQPLQTLNKLSDSMLNTQQLLEQMATRPQQTGPSNEMNDNASDSPSQDQEMETID